MAATGPESGDDLAARWQAQAAAQWDQPEPRLPPGWESPGRLPSSATMVLILGVSSLVGCGLLGPVAWALGSAERTRIDRGLADPYKRGLATAGMVCGIVATGLFVVTMLFVLCSLDGPP